MPLWGGPRLSQARILTRGALETCWLGRLFDPTMAEVVWNLRPVARSFLGKLYGVALVVACLLAVSASPAPAATTSPSGTTSVVWAVGDGDAGAGSQATANRISGQI